MIFLLRHGQTEYNIAHRIQGQLDSPLTAAGRAQAAAMGAEIARLAQGRRVSVHASPLGRAADSARIVAAQIPDVTGPRFDPRLQEISFGAWDGHTVDEIDLIWPGLRAQFSPFEWYFNGPGGEDLPGLKARLGAALAEVKADPAPIRVILAHGIANWVLRMVHSNAGPEDAVIPGLRQDSVQQLLPDGRVQLVQALVP